MSRHRAPDPRGPVVTRNRVAVAAGVLGTAAGLALLGTAVAPEPAAQAGEPPQAVAHSTGTVTFGGLGKPWKLTSEIAAKTAPDIRSDETPLHAQPTSVHPTPGVRAAATASEAATRLPPATLPTVTAPVATETEVAIPSTPPAPTTTAETTGTPPATPPAQPEPTACVNVGGQPVPCDGSGPVTTTAAAETTAETSATVESPTPPIGDAGPDATTTPTQEAP